MARVLKKAGIEHRTFYDLHRTFQTIAEGAHDLAAVQSIMGHAPSNGDMSDIYRQRVSDERLRAVTDYVHDWLFHDRAELVLGSRSVIRQPAACSGVAP
jgi:integrase